MKLNVIQHILKASKQHAKGAGRWMSLNASNGRIFFLYCTSQLHFSRILQFIVINCVKTAVVRCIIKIVPFLVTQFGLHMSSDWWLNSKGWLCVEIIWLSSVLKVFWFYSTGEWLRWTVVLPRRRRKRSPWMLQQHTQRTTRHLSMLGCPRKLQKVSTTFFRQVSGSRFGLQYY